jgi:hypothetical protein
MWLAQRPAAAAATAAAALTAVRLKVHQQLEWVLASHYVVVALNFRWQLADACSNATSCSSSGGGAAVAAAAAAATSALQ